MNETDLKFIFEQNEKIIDNRIYEIPSKYIESVRQIRPGLSPKPGFFEFSFTPYWEEPFNNLSPNSGISQMAIMKAAQIGYTVAILENAVIYYIGCEPKYVQFITADKTLAKEIVQERIDPAIDDAGLRDSIFAQSERKNSRATGDTALHKQYPGGAINFVGAKNPDSFRARTREITLGDEVDTWGDDKLEGSKVGIVTNRSNAMAETRKLVWGSTPLLTQTSQIYSLYKQGDQRHYKIQCPRCGEFITLFWYLKTDDHGKCGIVFKQEKGNPILDSVAYRCQKCGDKFKDYEKSLFLLSGTGYWEPTAESKSPDFRSYWLNALYSPPGVYSWERVVADWAKAWDLEHNKIKSMAEYRTFRNTKQGLPFTDQGESIDYTKAHSHRRLYSSKSIPNVQATKDTGTPILLVLCSVDVQKDRLFVDVKGYSGTGNSWTIEFFDILGNPPDKFDECWKDLDRFLSETIYTADDGKKYRIISTFVDSGKYTQAVYSFCRQYSVGVYPIKGERTIKGNLAFKLMSKDVREKSGCPLAYLINTTYFKDEIAIAFKTSWYDGSEQPPWRPNFPEDLRDEYFRQFEAESKTDVYDQRTKVYMYSYWKAKEGMDNHAFDTMVYQFAEVHVIAEGVCRENGVDFNWPYFWEYCKAGHFYAE